MGTRKAWSRRRRTSSGRPWASLPKTQAIGMVRSAESSVSPACPSAPTRLRPAARQAESTAPISRERVSETWKRLPAEARTHLPLWGSTVSPARITASAPAAGQRALQRNVDEIADRQDALWGNGFRQPSGGSVGDERGSGGEVGVAVGGGRGGEDLVYHAERQGFADGLGAFGEEAAGLFAAGPPGQVPSSSDPGCPLCIQWTVPGSWMCW